MAVKKEKKFSSFVNNPFDFPLLITIILLLAIGLIMVLSASSPTALAVSGDSYEYFFKQFMFAIGGLVLMFCISKVDYRFYKKYYIHALVIAIALLAAVLLFGEEINGATRWIYVTETLSFQPSEIAKILVIIFYAGLLTVTKDRLKLFWKGFILNFLGVLLIAACLIPQPHYSAMIVIIGTVSIMMLTAGVKFSHFMGVALAVGLPILIALIAFTPYRLERVITFLDPWQDTTDSGYQIVQSLYAIGSGGFFGVGLGESKQKFSYIPEPHNDFIFSILAEELGFVGCAAVIVLFGILIWRGILIALKSPDMFGSLIAIGITSLIAIQVIINIAVVTSSMPVTGMPLPFFSYGGTALVIILVEMGILLNISRATAKT